MNEIPGLASAFGSNFVFVLLSLTCLFTRASFMFKKRYAELKNNLSELEVVKNMKNSETSREYRLRIYSRSEKFFQKKVAVKISDGETSSRKWVLSNFNTWDRFNENAIDTFEVTSLISKFWKMQF